MIQPSIISDLNIVNCNYVNRVSWIFYFLNNSCIYFLFKKRKSLKLRYLKTIDKSLINFFKLNLSSFSELNKKTDLYLFYLNKNLFNINFLRKEMIYTKLKYSRVPQYDIVSGGSAALLAGFLGFLVAEKFGFELLDSGDFYFIFMYVVLISFFSRMLLKLFAKESTEFFNYYFLSQKWFFSFYYTILIFLKKIWGQPIKK